MKDDQQISRQQETIIFYGSADERRRQQRDAKLRRWRYHHDRINAARSCPLGDDVWPPPDCRDHDRINAAKSYPLGDNPAKSYPVGDGLRPLPDCEDHNRSNAAKSYPLGDGLRPLPDCRDLFLRGGLANGGPHGSSSIDGNDDISDEDTMATAAEPLDEFEQEVDNDVVDIELV